MKNTQIKKMNLIRYIAILLIGQWGIAQQDVFSRSEVATGNFGDGALPWYYQTSNNSQGDPDNGNTVRNYVKIGHNNNTTMTTNGRFYQLASLDFQAGASTSRTINNFNGGLSVTIGIYNASTGTHTFNTPVGIDGSSVQIHTNNTGGYVFSNTIFVNSNTINFGGNGSGSISVSGVLQGTGNVVKNGSNLLTLTGQNTYTGSTTINAGELHLNRTGGNTLPAGNSIVVNGTLRVSSNQTLVNLTINSGGKVIIEPGVDLQVTGTLTNNAGVAGIEIKSNVNGTASLRHASSDIPATVERYIPAKRAWRILAAPHKGTSNNTIAAQWQETGKDMLLWKPNGGDGFATGPQTNIYKYASGWQAVTTNAEPLFDTNGNKPMMVFVTGPHGSSNIASGADATTSTTTGNLITGNVNHTIIANTFNLLANPYTSALDIEGLITDNSGSKIWLMDPSTGIGAYYTYDGTLWTPNTPALENRNIQLGQGFFVRHLTNTSFTINANRRVTGSSSNWFAKQQNQNSSHDILRVLLYKNENNDFQLYDGVVTANHAQGNNAVDEADAPKVSNFSDNIMFRNGNSNLSIEYRALPVQNDMQPLRLSGTSETAYQLRIFTESYSNSTLTPYLEDLTANTLTAIPTDGSTLIYSFQGVVSSNTNPDNRFRIVYQQTLSATDNAFTSAAVYPNPVTNQQLHIRLPQHAPATYQVSNLLGQVIQKGNLTAIDNVIDLDIESGVYMLNIAQGNENYTNKIIVK